MKHICFLTTDMSCSGGTNKCTAMIANELVKFKNKYVVSVVDLHNTGEYNIYPLDEQIKYESLDGGSIPRDIARLRHYINKNKVDAIVNVEGLMGIYSLPACAFKKTKTVMWEHGNYFLKRYSKVDIVRWIEFKTADYYITLTEDDMQEFKKHFSGRCKLKYIYNACETIGSASSYDPRKKSIITVGMLRDDKGYDILVDVANKVHTKHPDWTWDIYGSEDFDKSYTDLIHNKVKEYGLEDFVRFHGLKKDMLNYYQNSAMMVMTSRREGLPMVLLEARGMGLPMIAFDIKTGPKEIIDDGINGYLVEPYDTDAMAEKINMLIEDIELRKKLSMGTQRGIEKFSIDRIIKEWDNLLEEI